MSFSLQTERKRPFFALIPASARLINRQHGCFEVIYATSVIWSKDRKGRGRIDAYRPFVVRYFSRNREWRRLESKLDCSVATETDRKLLPLLKYANKRVTSTL